MSNGEASLQGSRPVQLAQAAPAQSVPATTLRNIMNTGTLQDVWRVSLCGIPTSRSGLDSSWLALYTVKISWFQLVHHNSALQVCLVAAHMPGQDLSSGEDADAWPEATRRSSSGAATGAPSVQKLLRFKKGLPQKM